VNKAALKLLAALFPPCSVCRYYIRFCRCGRWLREEGCGR